MITIRNEGTSELGLSYDDFLMDGTALSTGDVTGDCLTSNIVAGDAATCNISSIGGTANQLSDGTLYNVLVLVLGPRNQAGGPVNC